MRDRLLLTGIGAGVGLGAGLTWWFVWGCRACARDSGPWGPFAFCLLAGVVMANAWGMEHLRNRRGGR